jgi:hypothetical protein
MSACNGGGRVITMTAAAIVAGIAGLATAQGDGAVMGAEPLIGEVSPTALYFRAGTVDASTPRDGLETLAGLTGRFVIQLDGPMTPSRRVELEAAGVKLGDYLPINSFVARFEGADAGRLAQLDYVRWHSRFDPAWKLAPDLGQRELKSNDRLFFQGLGVSALFVDLFEDADVAETTLALLALNDQIEVVTVGAVGTQAQLHVLAPTAVLDQLAAIDGVQFFEDAPELTTRNATTTWIIQSNVSGQTPLWDAGLHGEGQILGHIDGKININHCSFKDPEGDPPGPDHRKIVAYNTSQGSDTHGTHTAGTAAGDAGVAGDTRGMAYMAKIAYDSFPSFNENSFYNMLVQHEGQGARMHTNSWGNDGTTSYDGMCRAIDRFSYDYEDNLVAFAVTNQSFLKNPENAKNVLAVGASRDTPSQDNHCTGGAGPTNDGRRKPEIYAPGCSTRSSVGSGCSVSSLTGTSMACPAISGAGLLVRQYYAEGFYPSGLANPDDGFIPSGALIKSSLINGSVDMTGVSGYPSNREGWGRLIADYALYLDGDTRTMWTMDVRNASGMTTGETVEYPIEVTGSGEQFRVTIAFTDPAGTSGTNFAAVNDLDLEVVSPGGTVYKGNVFSGGVSITGGTKDDRNNVEQVHLNAPALGTWTVRVNGVAVNVGAQGYALVVTGEVLEPSDCVADFNGDGSVNSLDVLAYLNAWSAGDSSADINGDGTVDTLDFLEFLNLWNAGC